MYNQRTQFNATSEKLVPKCVFLIDNLKERMDKVLPRASKGGAPTVSFQKNGKAITARKMPCAIYNQ